MKQLELEWLTDKDWMPTSVKVFRGKKEATDEGFDDYWAKSMGYDNINHLNKHNHLKDMECLVRYGNNCKRNR